MNDTAAGTMSRADKGPLAPPPVLAPPLQTIVETISGWTGIAASVHWDLYHRSRVDGVDFYLGPDELGHLHLDGSIHLATRPALGATLVAEGAAKPFRYQAGWVEEQASRIGADAAIALFRRNFDDLTKRARDRIVR